MLVNYAQKNALSNALMGKWVEEMSLLQEKSPKCDYTDLQIFYSSNSKFRSLPTSSGGQSNKKQCEHSIKKIECFLNKVVETRNHLLNMISKNLKPKTLTTSNHDEVSFPFQNLPDICKLLVFSYLNEVDKGRSSLVCEEWNELLKSHVLWKNVDITFLKNSEHPSSLKSFSNFLDCENYQINSLTLDYQYSIENSHEMKFFLESKKCVSVKSIIFTQQLIDESTPDSIYKNRRGQRKSIDFLEDFVEIFPTLEHLTVPFDWTVHSVKTISKLNKLKSLKLIASSKFQNLEQSNLDLLLSSLTSLERLDIEIFLMSGLGFQNLSFESMSLKCLTLNRSKGLQIVSLKTPNLLELNINNDPFFGPLTLGCMQIIPASTCLHSILKYGAPKLSKINDSSLDPNWRCSLTGGLSVLLGSLCNCATHIKKLA